MIRVLLVDDENFMIEGLTKYIPWPDLGIDEVLTEDDPVRALALALEKEPDILITDIRMPKMDGIELARQIHEKLPSCSILFLTAYNEKEYLKSAILLRAVDFLEKPVDRGELCATVRKLTAEIKMRNDQLSMHSGEALTIRLAKPMTDADRALLLEPYSLAGTLPCIYTYIKTDSLTEAVLPVNIRKRLLGSIEALFTNPGCSVYAAMKQSDGFAVLLAGDPVPERPFQELDINGLEQIISTCFERPVKVFIGVGSRVLLTQAEESFRQAALCAQRTFFLGYSRMVHWNELHSGMGIDPDEVLHEFEKLLKSYDRKLILNYINNIIPDIQRDSSLTVQTVKNLLFRMLVLLENLGKSISPGTAEDNLWDKAETITSIEAFKSHLIGKIISVIPDDGRDTVSQYVAGIKKSIEDNYYRSDFSLETIARSVHLSMQYICRIFKEATGETINSRLISVRIAKAKELLKNDGLRLADVAVSVGYKSPNHFARIFREHEGVNPSVYRALSRHKTEP